MGCCGGHTLDDLRQLMQPLADEVSVVELRHGPERKKSPLGGPDIPVFPNTRDMYVNTVKLGYVNSLPGGPVFFLRHWPDDEMMILQEGILIALQRDGFDIDQERKWSHPPEKGLRGKGSDDDNDEKPRMIIYPD